MNLGHGLRGFRPCSSPPFCLLCLPCLSFPYGCLRERNGLVGSVVCMNLIEEETGGISGVFSEVLPASSCVVSPRPEFLSSPAIGGLCRHRFPRLFHLSLMVWVADCLACRPSSWSMAGSGQRNIQDWDVLFREFQFPLRIRVLRIDVELLQIRSNLCPDRCRPSFLQNCSALGPRRTLSCWDTRSPCCPLGTPLGGAPIAEEDSPASATMWGGGRLTWDKPGPHGHLVPHYWKSIRARDSRLFPGVSWLPGSFPCGE